MMSSSSSSTWRNDYTTSPNPIQDLPHDYSRSPLLSQPTIDDSAFVAYLWAIIIHVICSASMTFAGAAAGGPGSTNTPIVTIALLLQIGHAAIGLMKGQGLQTVAAPLLVAWPYAAVFFLGIPANRDDLAAIRVAAALSRRATFLLMALGRIPVPFSYALGAHLVLDFPDSGLLTLFENPCFPHGLVTPFIQLAVDTAVMYVYYDRVGIAYYQVQYPAYTLTRAFLFALGGAAYWWWIDRMQQQRGRQAAEKQPDKHD